MSLSKKSLEYNQFSPNDRFPRLPLKIILASTSIYRRRLLERLLPEFHCIAPDVDESAVENESPEALARRLSLEKASAVAERFPEALVIGSDQVAELQSRRLGKPGGRKAAIAQLRACSGQSVRFLTGLALCHKATGLEHTHIDPVLVRFRQLSDPEIRRYLTREQPYDCAGSFKVEGLGITLFDSVLSSDPTSLEGLPLIALSRLLRASGVDVP